MDDDSALALERAVLHLGGEGDEEDGDSSEDNDATGMRGGGQSDVFSLYSERTLRPESRLSLPSIIEDYELFAAFRRFLKDQCITRNLNFWLACQHFRQQPPENRQQLHNMGKAIYTKFIKNSAPQKINLHEATKRDIKLPLEMRSALTPRLFDKALTEVAEIMEKNELRQFLVSEAFSEVSAAEDTRQSMISSVYTPSAAHPTYGVCGGGSLQHSSSEDSASITSFSTDSDAGARSAVFGVLNRPVSTRKALSDTEGTRHHGSTARYARNKPLSHKEFMALVKDRLLAVAKDREAMQRKAQDAARAEGKTSDEVMAVQWYDLPEAARNGNSSPEDQLLLPPSSSSVSHVKPESQGSNSGAHSRPPSTKHIPSPSIHSPIGCVATGSPTHIDSLAKRQVEDALKDLEITRVVQRKHRSGCSSVLSSSNSCYQTSTDSGVGDTLALNGATATPYEDRVHSFVRTQEQLSRTRAPRSAMAQVAATVLIHNSPQQESLNPNVPPPHGLADKRDSMRHHPPVGHHHRYPNTRAYSSEDSSSCFTMTSQSSTSDLFIPRRTPHHSMYSDSDDPRHYSSRYHRPRQVGMRSRHSHHPPPPPSSHTHNPHPPPPPHPSSHQPQHHQHQPPPPSSSSHQHHQHQHRTTTPMPAGSVLVMYYLDSFPTPYGKRLNNTSEITLADFKEKVFARNGMYRFFFQTYYEDLGTEMFEEFSSDHQLLPVSNGKIIGRVEKME